MEDVERAIRHAVRAVACRQAVDLDRKSAGLWTRVADHESRLARIALADVCRASGCYRSPA